MRLLHLHDAPHIPGGATSYLGRVLDEAARRGHQQWAWSLDQEVRHPALLGTRAYLYPWPRSPLRRRQDFHGWHQALADHLLGWIHELSPELIHVQNCAPFRTTVFPALERSGVPVLMTVHDFSLADSNPAGRSRSGPRGWLRSWLDARSMERARQAAFQAVDRFLCPTKALLTGLGLPSERVELHRLPIELADPAPWPAPPQNQPMRLFFAGSLYRSKGVDLLLRALARLSGPASGATLEIAGDGDQATALRALTAELGLSQRVRFLGHCGRADMDRAYAACHLLVLPSRVPENSPLTVLEAGARGRPAIAAARGGVPELLAGERGWTFRNEDPEDLVRAIEAAAADPEELRARGARMRGWVREEFDPRRHWQRLEAVWRELAAGGAPR